MNRKNFSSNFEPMDYELFLKIKNACAKRGIYIQQNEQTDRYLEKYGVEGATLNAHTILLMQNPSRSSVFEELIHCAQYRLDKNDGSPISRVLNEIEAQKKLIRNQKAYGISDAENEQTKLALKNYEKELSILMEK